jgi:hypothetical protein
MSRPNNRIPNDQQRESQDFLAKQARTTHETKKADEALYTQPVEPVASIQRKEID